MLGEEEADARLCAQFEASGERAGSILSGSSLVKNTWREGGWEEGRDGRRGEGGEGGREEREKGKEREGGRRGREGGGRSIAILLHIFITHSTVSGGVQTFLLR